MDLKCSFCNNPIAPIDRFCPNCGNKINTEGPLTTAQKTKIYIASVILVPFGLYWFFKYYKNSDKDKRKVAYSALFLTLFMLLILVVINIFFVESIMNYLNIYTQNLELVGLH